MQNSHFPSVLNRSEPQTNISSNKIHTNPEAFLYTIQTTDYFYDYALTAALQKVDAHVGSLFIWDEFRKELTAKAMMGPQQRKIANVRIKLNEGIMGWVGKHGKSILIENGFSEAPLLSQSEFEYRATSFISAPIIVHNRLLGVINITERNNLLPFTHDDRIVIEDFVFHLGMAHEALKTRLRYENDNEKLHHAVAVLSQRTHEMEPYAAVGKLASNLAHELNNPIDAIRRYVNLALDQSLENSLLREYLLKTKTGIRRAIRVIRGLLKYSREVHQPGTKSSELHSVLIESFSNLDHDPTFQQIKIETKFTAPSSYVKSQGLSVVFQNILQNAAHAMSGIGTINVSTAKQGDSIVIAFEDSGPGIPKNVIQNIFTPFFTTKNDGQGTGIGLTLCREIIEKNGGKIHCENGEVRGAKFVITLPLTDMAINHD